MIEAFVSDVHGCQGSVKKVNSSQSSLSLPPLVLTVAAKSSIILALQPLILPWKSSEDRTTVADISARREATVAGDID